MRGSFLGRIFSTLFQRLAPRSVRRSMDPRDLMKLSKEDLVEKVKFLEETCESLRKTAATPTSKYEALVQKFRKHSSKTKKLFDATSCGQRKVALKVAYFGWDYMGLQDNPGLEDTIEKIMFESLSHTKLILGELKDCAYSKCGRTDKGVSAFSQVLCFNLRSRVVGLPTDGETLTNQHEDSVASQQSYVNSARDELSQGHAKQSHLCGDSVPITELDYCGILNRVLPQEIRVLAWAAVDDETFSARYNCIGRVYKYFFPRGSLDIQAMDIAAKLLVGTHDFRNFCKMNVEERTNFVRDLRGFDIAIENSPQNKVESPYQMCVATINGTGFLYHQIRHMMGILFLIGMRFEKASVITELLDIDKMPRRPQYGLMADYPLVLYDCYFENLKWNVSEDASGRLLSTLQQFWSTLAIKTALAKSMLDKFVAELPPATSDIINPEQEQTLTTNVQNFFISGYLMNERYSSKQYKKVTKRQTGRSLQEKIESMENRKKRKLAMEIDKQCMSKTTGGVQNHI